ncbi:MAG TPA: hypothetical protein VFE46_10245 [Pirellulales bacterium]|jgi:hypothetical protein|nr:hypothetical protein [Pirellulales bacterium]
MSAPQSRKIWIVLPLALVATVCVATWIALAQSPQNRPDAAKTTAHNKNQYVRVKYDEHGNPLALETSIVHLVPVGNDRPGLQVDLVSAVHVAEPNFYAALNKQFENYDVVLYELVAPEGTVIPKGGPDRNRNLLSSLQNAMKDLLELEYQLSGIDYTKQNFVHADFSPDQFAQSMKDRGESFWTIFMRLMAAGMVKQASNPGKADELDVLLALFDHDRAVKLKRIMAEEFSDMDTIMTAFNGPDGSTLITERNKAALKVLGEQIAAGKKKIAIFYGGGHMPDMEPRACAEFHLQRAGEDWLEAWNLRDKK